MTTKRFVHAGSIIGGAAAVILPAVLGWRNYTDSQQLDHRILSDLLPKIEAARKTLPEDNSWNNDIVKKSVIKVAALQKDLVTEDTHQCVDVITLEGRNKDNQSTMIGLRFAYPPGTIDKLSLNPRKSDGINLGKFDFAQPAVALLLEGFAPWGGRKIVDWIDDYRYDSKLILAQVKAQAVKSLKKSSVWQFNGHG